MISNDITTIIIKHIFIQLNKIHINYAYTPILQINKINIIIIIIITIIIHKTININVHA